MDIKIRPS